MHLGTALLAIGSGFLVAVVTAPVGVSGAVFLLPVQLDVLRVPSPAVTPTNLLFNIIAAPGALLRYYRTGRSRLSDGNGVEPGRALTRRLLLGTLPGVVIGTLLRVYAAPGDRVFRLIAALVLLPLGIWLCTRRSPSRKSRALLGPATITALGLVVGVVGGLYGIGGGSLLGPILVGGGLPVATVAPAALAATFLTSIAGVVTYSALSFVTAGPISPNWTLGILCGLGGLLGGYLGARVQPHVPETGLRTLLGALAIGLAIAYISQALRS